MQFVHPHLAFPPGGGGFNPRPALAGRGVLRADGRPHRQRGIRSHAPSARWVFAGTEAGAVKQFRLPLGSAQTTPDAYVHSAPVTRMRLAFDDAYLFSAGEDGCVAVYEVSGKERGGGGGGSGGGGTAATAAGKKDKDSGLPWAEEILVTKADLEEKLNAISELRNKVEELQLHNGAFRTSRVLCSQPCFDSEVSRFSPPSIGVLSPPRRRVPIATARDEL